MKKIDQDINCYPLFQPNQVLTHNHLNRLTDFINHQHHLTRVKLIGTGITRGLLAYYENISETASKIILSFGEGITTEGDLIHLSHDTCNPPEYCLNGNNDSTSDSALNQCICTHYRQYKDECHYTPFLKSPGDYTSQYEIFELLTSDRENARLITPEWLGDEDNKRVLLLYQEIIPEEIEQCTDDNCDEKGKRLKCTLRKLLIPEELARQLIETENNDTGSSQKPGEVFLERFGLWGEIPSDRQQLEDIDNVDDFVQEYRRIIQLGGTRLEEALYSLFEYYSPLFETLIGLRVNPFDEYDQNGEEKSFVKNLLAVVDISYLSVQYVYDYLNDMKDAYNELLNKLSHLESLRKAPQSFPHHLLIGELSDNTSAWCEYRHSFIPAFIDDHRTQTMRNIKQLMMRLMLMVKNFHWVQISSFLDPAMPVRITPDHPHSFPLGQRAIPFYYDLEGEGLPLIEYWDFESYQLSRQPPLPGYHAAEYLGDTYNDRVKPLLYNFNQYSRLRIEGHLGKDIKQAVTQLESLRRQYNIPFDILPLKLAPGSESTENIEYLINQIFQGSSFSRFNKTNHGMEHIAGTTWGGTFILVYRDIGTRRIEGIVKAAGDEGIPLGNVKIMLDPDLLLGTSSNEEDNKGTFKVDVPANRALYLLYFSLDEYNTAEKTVIEKFNNIQIILSPINKTVELGGHVYEKSSVKSQQHGLKNVEITYSKTLKTKTDKKGEFSLAVPENDDGKYDLMFKKSGYITGVLTVKNNYGNIEHFLTPLSRKRVLNGRVKFFGNSMPGIIVQYLGDRSSGILATALTNRDGSFKLTVYYMNKTQYVRAGSNSSQKTEEFDDNTQFLEINIENLLIQGNLNLTQYFITDTIINTIPYQYNLSQMKHEEVYLDYNIRTKATERISDITKITDPKVTSMKEMDITYDSAGKTEISTTTSGMTLSLEEEPADSSDTERPQLFSQQDQFNANFAQIIDYPVIADFYLPYKLTDIDWQTETVPEEKYAKKLVEKYEKTLAAYLEEIKMKYSNEKMKEYLAELLRNFIEANFEKSRTDILEEIIKKYSSENYKKVLEDFLTKKYPEIHEEIWGEFRAEFSQDKYKKIIEELVKQQYDKTFTEIESGLRSEYSHDNYKKMIDTFLENKYKNIYEDVQNKLQKEFSKTNIEALATATLNERFEKFSREFEQKLKSEFSKTNVESLATATLNEKINNISREFENRLKTEFSKDNYETLAKTILDNKFDAISLEFEKEIETELNQKKYRSIIEEHLAEMTKSSLSDLQKNFENNMANTFQTYLNKNKTTILAQLTKKTR